MSFAYDKKNVGFIMTERGWNNLSDETKFLLNVPENLEIVRNGYKYGKRGGVKVANLIDTNGIPLSEKRKTVFYKDLKNNLEVIPEKQYDDIFGVKEGGEMEFPNYVFFLNDEQVVEYVNYFTRDGTANRYEMIDFFKKRGKNIGGKTPYIRADNRPIIDIAKANVSKGQKMDVENARTVKEMMGSIGAKVENVAEEEPTFLEEEEKEEIEPFVSTDLTTGTETSIIETVKGTAEEVFKEGLKSNEGIISAGIGGTIGAIATGAIEGALGTGNPIGAVVGAVAGGLASEKVKNTIESIANKPDDTKYVKLEGDKGSVSSVASEFDVSSRGTSFGERSSVPSTLSSASERDVSSRGTSFGERSSVPSTLSSASEFDVSSGGISFGERSTLSGLTGEKEMDLTETTQQTMTEELPKERVGKNLYKPIHEDAIYLFFGPNLEWDTNLLAHRVNSPEWKDISNKKQFMLEQSRMIVKAHGDKILVPKLIYGENSSVENILKENFEILELYMSYTNNRRFPRTFPNGSGTTDKVVSMRLNDLIEYRKQFEGEGFESASMAPSVIEAMGETKESSGMKVMTGTQPKNGITTLQTEADKPKFLDPTIANKINDETMRLTKPSAVPVRNQKHILGYTNIHSKENLRGFNKSVIKGSFGVPNYRRNLDGQIHLDGDRTATEVGGSIPMKKMAVKGDCKTTGIKL